MENAWKQLEWDAVALARAIALACRLDRQLEEVAAVASRAESRLAGRLRTELQEAAATVKRTAQLFATIEVIHGQLAYLPRPGMPMGVRVFLRELFGERWDEDIVVAPVSTARWPLHHDSGGEAVWPPSPERPVAVIPQAELRNPLMWPLIAMQGARIVGWTEVEHRVGQLAGPGVWFAMAEAMLPAAASNSDGGARTLWQRGWDELSRAGSLYDDARELARALADGILISARRVGFSEVRGPADIGGESARVNGTRDGADIYQRLAAVRDVPADAIEILSAGWIHWYTNAAPKLLETVDWPRRREIVDGVDDVLCRSLDVAAIHRFFASEGAST